MNFNNFSCLFRLCLFLIKQFILYFNNLHDSKVMYILSVSIIEISFSCTIYVTIMSFPLYYSILEIVLERTFFHLLSSF
jgi:hypothetical protein